MSEWEDKSNFEINKAVAKAAGYLVQDIDDSSRLGMTSKFHERYPDVVWVADVDRDTGEQCSPWEQKNFTGDWADAGPIIEHEQIAIEPIFCFGKLWQANIRHYKHQCSNPLRAAMIVYLEMNGVKP